MSEKSAEESLQSLFSDLSSKSSPQTGDSKAITPQTRTSKKTGGERKSPPDLTSLVGFSNSPLKVPAKASSHSVAVDAAIDTLPGWYEKPAVKTAMTKRKQQSMLEVVKDNFTEKAKKTP